MFGVTCLVSSLPSRLPCTVFLSQPVQPWGFLQSTPLSQELPGSASQTHTLHPIPQSLTAGLRLFCPPGALKKTAQDPSFVPTWSQVADFSLPWLDTSWPQVHLPDLPYPSLTAQEEKLSCPSSPFDSNSSQDSSGIFHQELLPTQIYSR